MPQTEYHVKLSNKQADRAKLALARAANGYADKAYQKIQSFLMVCVIYCIDKVYSRTKCHAAGKGEQSGDDC